MRQPKTLQDREKELRLLLATPEGRAELQDLALQYEAAGGSVGQRRRPW